MWTPPPITEVDEVRMNAGCYTEAEVMMAWYMQTREGKPWNVMLYFTQYDSIEAYLERNPAAEIANQIDWWTGSRMYNIKNDLSERHLGYNECWEQVLEYCKENGEPPPDPEHEDFVRCAPYQYLDGEVLHTEADEHALEVPIFIPAKYECTYFPNAEEIAEDMIEHDYIWVENIEGHPTMCEAWNIMRERPEHEQLMKDLNYYAENRRALTEDLERRDKVA